MLRTGCFRKRNKSAGESGMTGRPWASGTMRAGLVRLHRSGAKLFRFLIELAEVELLTLFLFHQLDAAFQSFDSA